MGSWSTRYLFAEPNRQCDGIIALKLSRFPFQLHRGQCRNSPRRFARALQGADTKTYDRLIRADVNLVAETVLYGLTGRIDWSAPSKRS